MHIDKLLPFVLERTCFVYGDRELYEAYEEDSEKFLKEGKAEEGEPVYQARAMRKLLGGRDRLQWNRLRYSQGLSAGGPSRLFTQVQA